MTPHSIHRPISNNIVHIYFSGISRKREYQHMILHYDFYNNFSLTYSGKPFLEETPATGPLLHPV